MYTPARAYGLFLRLLVVALLGHSAASFAQPLDRQKSGVVKITSQLEGKRRTGTGFIVRLEREAAYILTASHVIEGDAKPEVEFFTRRNTTVRAETLRTEPDDPRGLAVLVVRGSANIPPGLSVLPIAEGTSLTGGEEVTAIGFPQGGGAWAVVQARVVSREGRDLTLDGSIDEGSSGGPVLMGGRVVGVIATVEGKFGRAVPAAIAKLVLDGWGVRAEPTPSLPPTEPATTADGRAPAARPAVEPPTTTRLRVTEIKAQRAEPAQYKGACPVTISFSWQLSVAEGTGPVTYQVLRGDRTTGPRERVSFDSPGSKDVRYTWTLGREDIARNYSSWVALRVLAPQEIESEKIYFQADCQPSASSSAREAASIKVGRVICEDMRIGSSFRVSLAGEAYGPVDARLRVELTDGTKTLSRPNTSCRGWTDCQRQSGEPDATRWSTSTIALPPLPTQVLITISRPNAPASAPDAEKRVELRCRGY